MSSILLIDSEQKRLESLKDLLPKAGLGVFYSKCAVSGLSIAKQEIPQIIIVMADLNVVTIDDFLNQKKKDNSISNIPTLILSNSSHNKIDCYKKGCDGFIELPIDDAEMLFRIHSILRLTQQDKISSSSSNESTEEDLSGNFNWVSLVDIIQLFISSRKNGVCVIQTLEGEGEIHLKQGQVIHAELSDKKGEKALQDLLRICREGGTFTYSSKRKPVDIPTINKKTEHLLLGLTDEKSEKDVA